MKRSLLFFIGLIKKTLEYPVLWIGMIYLIWFVLIPITIEENFSVGIGLLGLYFVITVLEKLLGGNKILSIVLLIFLLPVALISGLFLLILMSETVGWLGREIIYIPLILLFSGYAAYKLYQKPANDNKTLRIFLFIVILPVLSLNFAQPITLFPKVRDQKDVGNDRYYLVSSIENMDHPHHHLTLYKCKISSIRCEELYRRYSQMFVDKIIFDKEKNEVSVIDSDYELGLAYTYGDNPRSYDGYSVEIGEHAYQLSEKHDYGNCGTLDCDTYIYTVYECNLDYTSCDQLPVQYDMTSGLWVTMMLNEATGEIELYDNDDRLIFTYGEHPVCYVSGCVILDK